MKHVIAMVLGVAMIAVVAPLYAADAPKGLPSTEDLRGLFNDKKYSEMLLKMNRVLALSGEAAKGYDRYELLTLKGEAMIQLKSGRPAAEAFAAAAKEATDRDRISEAKATEVLVKKCPTMSYLPKAGTGKKEPINFVDKANRKAAFAALLADELPPLQKRAEGMKNSTALQAMVTLAMSAADLTALEFAASGNDSQTSGLRSQLLDQASGLLSTAMQTQREQISKISAAANQIAPGDTSAPGLSGNDRRAMKRIAINIREIFSQANSIAERLGEDGKKFADVAKQADALNQEIDKLTKADRNNDGGGGGGRD